jgi:hypothetical protein
MKLSNGLHVKEFNEKSTQEKEVQRTSPGSLDVTLKNQHQ